MFPLASWKISNYAEGVMSTFEPPVRQTLVAHMDRLFAILNRRGLPQTFLNNVTKGDPAWTRDYRNKDFRVGTVDAVFSRLSAIWPADTEWPQDIPRPEPAAIEPGILLEVADRLAKAASPNTEKANG